MINIAICDDNKLQLKLVEDLIEEYISTSNARIEYESFSNADQLIKHIDANSNFNIYVLDIIMPKKNGIELAQELRKKNDSGIIIFLTSEPNYAEDSYDVDAFYYLVKPVDKEKLFAILDKAVKKTVRDNGGNPDAINIDIKII